MPYSERGVGGFLSLKVSHSHLRELGKWIKEIRLGGGVCEEHKEPFQSSEGCFSPAKFHCRHTVD